jgi:hypothetical protein
MRIKKKDKDKKNERLNQSQLCAEGKHLKCNGIKCDCECHAT